MPACECEFLWMSLCVCSHVCVFTGADHTHSRMLFLSLPSLSLTSLMRSAPPSPRRLYSPLCCRLQVQCPATGSAHSSGQNPVQDFPRIFSEALYLPNSLDVATDSSRSNQWIRLLPPTHTQWLGEWLWGPPRDSAHVTILVQRTRGTGHRVPDQGVGSPPEAPLASEALVL